jgi:hypothetical protein
LYSSKPDTGMTCIPFFLYIVSLPVVKLFECRMFGNKNLVLLQTVKN